MGHPISLGIWDDVADIDRAAAWDAATGCRYASKMRAEVAIANPRLNDGTVVDLPDRGVVLIVGPNNAGKSQFLRDVAKLVSSPAETAVVVVGA